MRLLVTAGPTREYFDSIRYISNPSSGKMGCAIAAAAACRGHDVTLVCGPIEVEPPRGVRIVRVVSADEMLKAARSAFTKADTAVFAAAVCDWRPVRRSARKIAKSQRGRLVQLAPTPDIASTLGRAKAGRITVGFALEDHDGRAHAEAKLRRKRFDAILLNAPAAIGGDRAAIHFLCRGDPWADWGELPKKRVAERLVNWIERAVAIGRAGRHTGGKAGPASGH